MAIMYSYSFANNSNKKVFDPETLPSLWGRIALVTGGNTGIGYATVLELAKKGAKVYLAARSEERGKTAIEKLKKECPGAEIIFLNMDLSEPKSINRAVEEFRSKESRLHILVNNAGIRATPYSENSEGIEIQWATNYVGPFRLTNLLMPQLIATARASNSPNVVRVINLSSAAHKVARGVKFDEINMYNNSTWSRYGQSKLANILHTRALKKRYGSKGILFAAVHPGIVGSELGRGVSMSYGLFGNAVMSFMYPLYSTPEQGAAQTLYCAASKEFTANDSGDYYVPGLRKSRTSSYGADEKLADELWDFSTEKYEI